MKLIRNIPGEIIELFELPHTCQIKGCNNPIFAVVVFTRTEAKDTKVLEYPICREHCIEGSKLGTVIWDFKEREE